MCRLFDLSVPGRGGGSGPPSIRQFENYIEMLLGFPPEACGMAGVCGMQHVVEADGSVYPCDFYVLDGYRLGNLCTDSLEEINRRREALGFVQQSRGGGPGVPGLPPLPPVPGRLPPLPAGGGGRLPEAQHPVPGVPGVLRLRRPPA